MINPVDNSTKIHFGRRVSNVVAGTIAATHNVNVNKTTTAIFVESDPISKAHRKLVRRLSETK